MNSISDDLDDWVDVDKAMPNEDRGLLLGNGASMALWPNFRYSSLFEVAKDPTKPDHLTECEINLFREFETENFEAVLSAMIIAGKIWKMYSKPEMDLDDLRSSYSRVRKSLIRAVKEVHIPFDKVSNEVKENLRQIYSGFSYVYSTNYDLLLYWSMMTEPTKFKDFIWGIGSSDGKNYFDLTDTDLWDERNPVTKVLFLHGGLQLYKQPDGRTFKRFAGEDGNLLELFDVKGDSIPLFISEGTSKDKLSAIARNDYLSFAYQRFSQHRGSLVIFGHSLSPQYDQHLIDAILKWKRYDEKRKTFQKVPDRRVIAISVFPDDDSDRIIQTKSRISKVLRDYEVRFFDSTTYPLSNPTASV